MLNKGYQIEATSYANLALSVHDRINDLHRRAEGLAPAVAESALDSGCTDQIKASHANLGPRQRRAWDMVAEAHAWNAISDSPAELAKAEAAERAGRTYEVVGVWEDFGHTYVVRLDGQDAIVASAARHGHATTCTAHGGRDLAACDPADCDEAALAASFTVTVSDTHTEADPVPVPAFVADPTKPTDAELAAAIQRGLATGQLVDATDWLAAQRSQDADEAAAQADTKPYSSRLAREDDSPRCGVCHRDAHRPGTGWQGHDYAAPQATETVRFRQARRGHFHDPIGLYDWCQDPTCTRVIA